MEGEIVLTSVDLLTLLTQSFNVCLGTGSSIQHHMVTPASHPIGVGRPINHVKNKKYSNFVFISSLTGQYAAQKKNFCSSSLWPCLHHMVILRSQNKITDFFMTLAWVWAFNPLNTRSLCYCALSETRLFYDVIVISCNQTRRSPGLVSEWSP